MIGTTVSHYKILAKLGEGGMGVVYKAQDLTLDRPVAMKFLPTAAGTDENARQRFIHEAKAISALDHTNITTVHEIDRAPDGRMFIVMAYHEGETLEQFNKRDRIDQATALDIAVQIATGLDKAHKHGIVHRDIKPANIMITKDKEVKIVDFGLAKLVGHTRMTKTGTTVGTVAYMSPEQAKGEEVDLRSDLYSLGVVLYELLIGHLPFRGEHEAGMLYKIINEDPEPISKFRYAIPEGLVQIIQKSLNKDPDERYQSADELIRELTAVRDEAERAKSERKYADVPHGGIGGRTWWVRAGILAAIVVLFVSVTWWFGNRARETARIQEFAVALVDFRDLATPDDPRASAGLTSLVHVGLVENSPCRVVSPEHLYALRRRLFGSARGPIEEDQALEVARESGATMLLTGQLVELGSIPYVTLRLVDTQSGKSLSARRVKGNNILLLADQIVAEIVPLLARRCGSGEPESVRSVGELTTSSPDAYNHYVEAAFAREGSRNDVAIENLEEAVRIDSTFALAFLELTRAHVGQDFRLSWEYIERAQRHGARLSVKDRLRLQALRHQLEYRAIDALDTYRDMLDRWPDDRDILCDLSSRLYFWWYLTEALSVTERGITFYPEDLELSLRHSATLTNLGQLRLGLDAAKKLVENHSESVSAWDELGLSYLSVGFTDQAESAFRRSLEINPHALTSLQGIGSCAYARGDLKRAIAVYEQILEQTTLPEERVSVVIGGDYGMGLALLYAEAGQFRKALGCLGTIRDRESNPVNAVYLDRLRNRILIRIGRGEEVLQWSDDLANTIQLLGNSDSEREYQVVATISMIECRARALVETGSVDEARVAVKQLRESENQWGGFGLLLAAKVAAEIALAENNLRSEHYLDVAKRRGIPFGGLFDIEYRENLAQAYRLAGKLEQAENELEELLRLYGGHAVAYFDLGQIYEATERPAMARHAYTTFLTMWSGADQDQPTVKYARQYIEPPELQITYQTEDSRAFDEPPKLVESVSPPYPRGAREAGITGTVLIRVLVKKDGRVGNVEVLDSDVTPDMERAAVEAAWQCIFRPARLGEDSVQVYVKIPFKYEITYR